MSNKAKTVLFNAESFLTGTMFLSNEQIGKYIRALCAQQLHGHLSQDDIDEIVQGDPKVMNKFNQDQDGLYFNEKMDKEARKSATYSERQADKARKRWQASGAPIKNYGAKTPGYRMVGGKNADYDMFKSVFPQNGSALNPECENYFVLHGNEIDTGAVLKAATEYADYWKAKKPEAYPHCTHMKQAINWLREKYFLIDWKAKSAGEQKETGTKKKGVL